MEWPTSFCRGSVLIVVDVEMKMCVIFLHYQVVAKRKLDCTQLSQFFVAEL